MVGNLISKLLAIINSIIIIRLLTVQEYGLWKVASIIPNILLIVGELGLNNATIHFITRMKKGGDFKGIKDVIRINILVKFIISIVFMIIIDLNAKLLALEIFFIDDPRLITLIIISSFGIFTSILCEATFPILVGYEYMKSVRLGMILRIFLRILISLAIIVIGFALYGPMIGFVLCNFITLIYNFIIIKKRINLNDSKNSNTGLSVLSKMIKYSYPLTISSIILGLQVPIYEIIITIVSGPVDVGYFEVAIIISGVMLILTHSISISFFQNFSKYKWEIQEEKKMLVNNFKFSLKMSSFMIFPLTYFLIFFSKEILPLIFGNEYLPASLYISLFLITFFFVPFGSLSIPAFLKGQKQTKRSLLIDLINFISSLGFGLIFLYFIGSIGFIVGLIFGLLISTSAGILLVLRKYEKILLTDLANQLKIFLIATFSAIFSYIYYSVIINIIPIRILIIDLIVLFSSLVTNYVLFLSLTAIFSLITLEDLDSLENSFKKIILINKLLALLSVFLKKVMKLKKKTKDFVKKTNFTNRN